MTKSAFEETEAGGVMIPNKYGSRRFWGITLLCSTAVMAISLLIFCLTGKANNREGSAAYALMFTLTLLYAMIAMAMWCGCVLPPPPGASPREIDPIEMALWEQTAVVLICIVTLLLGKIVEVFIYTMSFITGFVAICQLPSPMFGMNHLWLIIGLGTLTELICLIPTFFFFLGWFSILTLTFVFLLRFNFPDKTLVQVFAML